MKTTIGTITVNTVILTINCTTYDIYAVMSFSDSLVQTMSYIGAIPSKVAYFCYNVLASLNSGSTIEVPSSINFYYDNLVAKFSPVITCNNSNTLIMPTAHRRPMNWFTHGYLLYMFLYRMFNHPIMQMLFLVFIAYFMQLVSGIANSGKKSRLTIIILFFNFITKANVSDVLSSKRSIYILLGTIENFFLSCDYLLIILYYIILYYYIVLYYLILYCIVLYCIILYYCKDIWSLCTIILYN